jgi:oligo-1,6-glucosidase/alpha-glucosidase
LRAVADEFRDPPRFLVGEVFGDAETLRRYCGEEANGLHLVFLFQTLRTRFRGGSVRELIRAFEHAFPDPYVPTIVFGNHDRPRLAHRLGDSPEKAKLLATLQLTARGVPFIYYGEEIGMGHHDIPLDQGRDPVAARFRFVPGWLARYLRRHGILMNRDECRAPMQWHAGPNAGFSPEHASTWLPVHPGHAVVNVDAQEADPTSLLHCYRGLLRLRRERPALHGGGLVLLDDPALPRSVVAYRRGHAEGPRRDDVDVFLNFGDRPCVLDLREHRGRALFSSLRCDVGSPDAEHPLAPHEGVVLFDPA